MTISYLNRKKNPLFYSIEKVFSDVCVFLKLEKIEHNIFEVKHNLGLIAVVKNLLQIKKTTFNSIIHITGDVHYLVLALPSNRTILTIHDLGFIKNSKGFKKYILKKIWLDWPLSKLKYITTISEATKNDLIRISKCNPSKIKVINNPLSSIYKPYLKEFNIVCPVILHIGITPNKNLERTILALKDINCKLIIIGKIENKIVELLNECKVSYDNKINLSEEQLYNEYKNCDIVSFCSLLEGFGLPIIEAQAVGRVVLTSNIEPMISVASKDAAIFVNPYNVDYIKKGFETIIKNKELRESFIQKGLQNVKRFSINQIGAQYVELYKKVEDNLQKK